MIAAFVLLLALQADPAVEKVERVAGDVNRPLLWTPLRITLSSPAGYRGDVVVRSGFGFETAMEVRLAPGGRTTVLVPSLDPKEVVAGKTVHPLARDFVRPERVVLVDSSLPYASELTSTPQVLIQKLAPEDLQALRPQGLLEAADLILTKENAAARGTADQLLAAPLERPEGLEAVDRGIWATAPRDGWVPAKKTWALFFAVLYAFSAFVALAVLARRAPKFGLACVAGVAVLGIAGYGALFPRNHLWVVCDRVEEPAATLTHRVWFLNAASELTTQVEFPLLVKPIFASAAGTDDPYTLRVGWKGCRVEGLKLGVTRTACFGATESRSRASGRVALVDAVLVRGGRAKFLGDVAAEAPLPGTVDGENAGLRSPAYAAWSRIVGKDALFGAGDQVAGASNELSSPDLADERVRRQFEIWRLK